MRVVECSRCCETLTAANDEELRRVVRDHLAAEHPEEDADEVQDVVVDAYDAMDS